MLFSDIAFVVIVIVIVCRIKCIYHIRFVNAFAMIIIAEMNETTNSLSIAVKQ